VASQAAGGVASAGDGKPAPAAAHTLIMVEQPGCFYCIRWHEEIAPAYPKTDIGAFAPLRSEQLRAIPDDLTLDRRVVFTPTFIIVNADGTELGRLEGYPGQDFFWPMLEQMLVAEAGYAPDAAPHMVSTVGPDTTKEN
jgi:thioredoxin-related protein